MNKLLILLLSSLLSMPVLADKHDDQGKDPRQPPHPEKRLKHLRKELSLSPEQAEEINAIMKSSHEQARQFRETLREQTNAEIMQVLNPEQQKQFADMKEQQGKQGKKHGKKSPESQANADQDKDS